MTVRTLTAPATLPPADRPPRFLLSTFFPYLLLAPSVLFFLGFTIYPLLYSARISLFSFRFGRESQFIGATNYTQALHDGTFLNSMTVTIVFTLFAVSLEFIFGLLLAVLLSAEIRLQGIYRTIFILPMVVTPVVVAIIWRLILETDIGVMNFFTRALFGRVFDFLGTNELALPSVIAVDVWEWTPFMFLVLLAGLQSLPLEPFEAARVDGATRWQIFRDLTLPMLRPIILVALLIRTMDALTAFDTVFIMTNGGPGRVTEMVSIFVYETAFKFSSLGYAAALIFVLLVVLVFVSRIYIAMLGDGESVASQ